MSTLLWLLDFSFVLMLSTNYSFKLFINVHNPSPIFPPPPPIICFPPELRLIPCCAGVTLSWRTSLTDTYVYLTCHILQHCTVNRRLTLLIDLLNPSLCQIASFPVFEDLFKSLSFIDAYFSR